MPLDSIRNSHGDLTVHALRSGYAEMAVWTEGDISHAVTLKAEGDGFRVTTATDSFQSEFLEVLADRPTTASYISLYFPEIKQARAEFKKRSRH